MASAVPGHGERGRHRIRVDRCSSPLIRGPGRRCCHASRQRRPSSTPLPAPAGTASDPPVWRGAASATGRGGVGSVVVDPPGAAPPDHLGRAWLRTRQWGYHGLASGGSRGSGRGGTPRGGACPAGAGRRRTCPERESRCDRSSRSPPSAWPATAFAQAPDTVFLEELTWTEVRDAVAAGTTTIIIPTGGTEQNGPHMVLGKHNYLVRHKAGESARRLGDALVAPVMAYVPEGNVDPPSGSHALPRHHHHPARGVRAGAGVCLAQPRAARISSTSR